jgi:hypothetical protein
MGEIFVKGQENRWDILMIIVSILGRGTTKKQPEASPASSVFYYYMMIGVRSCVSDGRRSGDGGDSSLCL